MPTQRKAIGLGLLGIAGAIDDMRYGFCGVENDTAKVVERLKEAYVRGEISQNEFIRRMETLERPAKGRTDQAH